MLRRTIYDVALLCAVTLPVAVLSFGPQHFAATTPTTTATVYRRGGAFSSPPSIQRLLLGRPTSRQRRQPHHHYLRPFWKSSSSSDNEKSSNDGENDNDEEDEVVPKLPSEEASTIPTSESSSSSTITPEISSTSSVPSNPTPIIPSSSAASDNSSSSSSTTPESSKEKEEREEGLLDLLNDVGQNFKPLAEKATAKGYQAQGQARKALYALQACIYYCFFILYRAYRGLFILMPAVFRQVYKKMELAMNAPDMALDAKDVASTVTPVKMTWRTRLTVSILASVVTVSYVMGATFKMAGKFVRTIGKSRSMPKSFEAAADELVTYEDRVSRIGKINGDSKMEPGGFAP